MIAKTTISAESLAENVLYVTGADFYRANSILERGYKTYSSSVRRCKEGKEYIPI